MRQNSIDKLYLEYMDDVYRYLLSLSYDHHLAEELLQETFMKAYLYLEEYNGGPIKPWLFTVAKNSYIDYQRKKNRVEVRDAGYFERLSSPDSTEKKVLEEEEWREIRSNIRRLPPREMEAIILHDFHQLSYREAAEMMNIRLSHYKILLYRARQKLRNNRKEGLEADE